MSELIACHHKVTLDIAKRDVCTIEVVNRDTANILEVNVCENGKEVSLENATLITITYSNDTVEEMQISEDFKTASVRINANCLKRGINFAKVCIYSGDNGLITAEMLTINCKQTVGGDNPAVPDPDMPKLKEMIAELVKQSASSEQIAAAVSQYLKDNPITETDPTVPDWAKEKNKPTYTAAEVGALSEGTLDTAINEALTAAKASGEFDGKSAYSYAQEGGYTGTEAEFAAKLAAEKLPNPYPLTFTGAVSGSYDGSAPLSVNIPSGGTGGGGALSGLAIADNYDIELISHVIIDQENIPTAGITVTQKDDGSPFAYDGLLIWTDAKSASSYTTFNFNGYTSYPIEMTHGNRNLLSMYITDGTTMSIIIDRVRNIIKQSHADTGNLFYPDAVFQRVPEKFTSFKIGADGIASVKFYKAWGLTRK